MLLQYSAAAAQAGTLYLFSALWTLTQSLVFMITAVGLDWIQSFGPMVLEWDSFLLGAVFLTMDIDPESLDEHMYPKMLTHAEHRDRQPDRQQHRQGSGSTLSSTNSKKVTFHEQVLVLDGAVQSGPSPIFTNGRFDPYIPISESPTRSSFIHTSPTSDITADHRAMLIQTQRDEAEYHRRMTSAASFSPVSFGSPSSSRSGSCQSSIRSVSSDSSDKEARHIRTTTSSRLAAFFHPHSQHRQHNSRLHDLMSDASQSTLERKSSGSKNLVKRIMHPYQHKREQEHQQQQQQQQQQLYLYEQHCQQQITTAQESMCCSMASNNCDCEYQPILHSRKTLIQRLGLKKKRSL
ncbi:hypothetical protein BGX28_005056 [Mortierella sp. GBA30]|nr:hypothetical protein BGX28_005056 [Mortierella sp. GBA30]